MASLTLMRSEGDCGFRVPLGMESHLRSAFSLPFAMEPDCQADFLFHSRWKPHTEPVSPFHFKWKPIPELLPVFHSQWIPNSERRTPIHSQWIPHCALPVRSIHDGSQFLLPRRACRLGMYRWRCAKKSVLYPHHEIRAAFDGHGGCTSGAGLYQAASRTSRW